MGSLEKAAASLEKRGFTVYVYDTIDEAKSAALELFGSGSVGFGGSVTVRDSGLYDELNQRGNKTYWHWFAAKEDIPSVTESARNADYYVCSANALTESGVIINIDGKGNRVAATFDGPPTVLFIVGQNKIAKDYEQAVERIKKYACGSNARRIGLNTPCAIDNICRDCNSAERMCRVVVSLEKPPMGGGKKIIVYLVRQDLGY